MNLLIEWAEEVNGRKVDATWESYLLQQQQEVLAIVCQVQQAVREYPLEIEPSATFNLNK